MRARACVGMCVLHLWSENLADQICTELVQESPPQDEPCIRIRIRIRVVRPRGRAGLGRAVREVVVTSTASRAGPAESEKIISAFGISDGAGMTEHSSFCIDTVHATRLTRQHATRQESHAHSAP